MSAEVCSLHGRHSPVNLTVEDHHVIPQAWQGLWCPPGATVHAAGLFDPCTVPICPSGHRNVHHFIVAIMRLVADVTKLYPTWSEVEVLQRAITNTKPRGHEKEFETATLAPTRWLEAGGSLKTLTDAGQWGEA